jgi:hypothetical protein
VPITLSDVRKVVTDEDDFGHEMRVSGLLQITPAIEFEHGGTYKDDVTGKPRQFDFNRLKPVIDRGFLLQEIVAAFNDYESQSISAKFASNFKISPVDWMEAAGGGGLASKADG